MEHREFGKTQPKVPVVDMETWQTLDVRDQAAEENARAVVEAAIGPAERALVERLAARL